MTTYMIVDSKVNNPKSMKEYSDNVGATIKQYGGEVLIGSRSINVIEGDWNPEREVIVKFEDDAAFKRWYNSPEYQEILPARLRSANDDIITVEN